MKLPASFYVSGLWAGTVETVPTKRMAKIVGTDLSVPNLTQYHHNLGRIGMQTSAFFVCPDCGNVKKFRIFTSNYQVVNQSPEIGTRIDESSAMPSLREDNNYVECPVCFKKLEYDTAVDIGKKYLQVSRRLSRKAFGKFCL